MCTFFPEKEEDQDQKLTVPGNGNGRKDHFVKNEANQQIETNLQSKWVVRRLILNSITV